MEGEWDKLIAPCLCWAGVETLYHDCFWLVDAEKETPQAIFGASKLINLCVRIVKDLQLVKQVLCEPHLLQTVDGSSTKSPQGNEILAAARKVSQALDSIVAVCQIRASLLDWLNRYFNHNRTQETLDEVEKLLAEVNGEDGALKLWKARLQEELALWQCISQAKTALESCR